MSPAERYLHAARVPDTLAEKELGLWAVIRERARTPAERAIYGWDTVTLLTRWTEANLHRTRGDIVMLDSRPELVQHLPVWMRAKGRVLITGLGLGCVVRALLTKSEVERVDVIEIDRRILDHVGPEFESDPRVRLVEGDALAYPVNGERWDYAWHDLWCEEKPGSDHLQLLHGQLLKKFRPVCPHQGAWKLPRFVRRLSPGLATLS